MLSIALVSSPPHRTLDIEVTYNIFDDALKIKALEAALREIEFRRNPIEASALPDGKKTAHYFRRGTASFGGWTPDEARQFEADARRVLGELGFNGVPRRMLEMCDVI